MVLQTSGRISLKDISVEFGGVVPHKLSEYYGVALSLPTTGIIKIGNFYGVSNNPDPPTWSTAASFGNVAPNTSFSRTVTASSDSMVTLSAVSMGFGTFSSTPGAGTTTNGTISGTTPNVSRQTYNWTIRATDAEGQSTDRTFSVLVSQVPTISTGSNLGTYVAGSSFAVSLSASSDSSITFSMASNPSNIGSVTSGGYFSGTAGSAGNYSWSIRATDQEGQSVTKTFTMSTYTPVGASWITNAYDLNSPYNGAYIYLGSSPAGGYVYYTMYSYANGTDPKYFTAQYLTSLTVDYSTGATYGYMPNVRQRVYWLMTVSNAWGSQTVAVVVDLY